MRMKKSIFLFVFFYLTFSTVNAQQKNQLEKLLDRGYRIFEGDSVHPKNKYLFVLPIWGISPETGWQLGLTAGYIFKVKQDSITRPSFLRLNTLFTQYHQLCVLPSADIFFAKNKYNLKAEFIYNDFNEKYWGIGNKVLDSAKENYDFKMHRLNAKLMRQFIKNAYAGVQFQYDRLFQLEYGSASITTNSGVVGIRGYSVFGLGLALAYDNRDNIYYPLNGTYIELSNFYYSKILGSTNEFENVVIDARKFVQLWNQNVLAMQVYGNFNFGDIPYRLMGTMGNEMIMRGYYRGRYRDNMMSAVQVELRKTIWGPLGFTVFGGAGNVGKNSKDLFSSPKANYGFGLRFIAVRKEHINFRMDMGFGEGNIRGLYFTMAEAF